ncbi:SurA N-terminal domain-containing protein [Yinghuangia sp. ASG 101]|uniref:SurA N-terminal domain-containing protein n=1 Tax=Yinghuangia sp. ASG 101 TaxID=2896848 RepID=UPI001E47A1DD|nr:SurA N-terminal domain-containing protein [Yinghuangia sp. ASG 101]UGQ14488.1 SurA N-terminal domain-containing protein [Yinghuangia sp. ASG 101]
MSRTSRSAPVVALAAVLAGFVLTGCSDTKTGAAAVVNGDRVEISTLNSLVEQAADARQSVGAEPVPGVEASQEELTSVLTDKVLDEAARRAGIVVTATEIADAKRDWAGTNPGATIETLLARQGVPASQVDHFVRRSVLIDKIIIANGQDPRTEAGQQKVVEVFRSTAESMDITVNPRYGQWNPADGLVPTTYGWLTPNRIA